MGSSVNRCALDAIDSDSAYSLRRKGFKRRESRRNLFVAESRVMRGQITAQSTFVNQFPVLGTHARLSKSSAFFVKSEKSLSSNETPNAFRSTSAVPLTPTV